MSLPEPLLGRATFFILFFVEKITPASPWLWSCNHSTLHGPDIKERLALGGHDL
ncbi:hypothetical protein A2U01_0072629, partial [Trifolium medium]|nr:hypothetical protein [Trifolium medium]